MAPVALKEVLALAVAVGTDPEDQDQDLPRLEHFYRIHATRGITLGIVQFAQCTLQSDIAPVMKAPAQGRRG